MGIFDKLKKKSKDATQANKAVKDSDTKKPTKSVEKKSEKTEKPKAPVKAKPSKMAHEILLSPMLTEKSFKLQQANKYSFFVATSANKHKVKMAIEEVYGVKPLSVNMSRSKAEVKKRWGREVGKTKATKKAIISMPEGTVLNLTD